MSDTGDDWRAYSDHMRKQRDKHTIPCPQCPTNRNPTRLWPGQKCRVCSYKDPRPDLESRMSDQPKEKA